MKIFWKAYGAWLRAEYRVQIGSNQAYIFAKCRKGIDWFWFGVLNSLQGEGWGVGAGGDRE
jgi:hypothetical protein